MRALTFYQPYASAVAAGVKTIETRSWAPPAAMRNQRIAIHAGKHHERHVNVAMTLERVFGERWALTLPYGAVVATATLADWYQIERPASPMALPDWMLGVTQENWALGDFATGRWAWHLTDIRPVDPPIEVRGYQGLWTLIDDVLDKEHACYEWDDMIIRPGDPEWDACLCDLTEQGSLL